MTGIPQGKFWWWMLACGYMALQSIVHVKKLLWSISCMYLHKKMRSLNSHCTGCEYFKDGLIVYMDIYLVIWLYTFQASIISNIIRRWRNLGFHQVSYIWKHLSNALENQRMFKHQKIPWHDYYKVWKNWK